MTDHFAVLRQPRRPWLDPDQLKQEYQQLSFAHHPDKRRTAADHGPDFAAVTDAYRVLSNPRLRLQHLLSFNSEKSDTEKSPITEELTEVFMQTAALVNDIEAVLAKREQATSALAKSMLKAQIAPLEERTNAQLRELQELYARTMDDLRRVDKCWDNDPDDPGELRELAQRFGFLDKWIGQLRERQFQLSN
jgi:curved DNA-binding protein CbpA